MGDGDAECDGAVERGKYGDLRINPDRLGNSYEQLGDDLKAKVHPNGRLYLRVRDSEDRRKWNEYSVPLGGE
jgi:hypothetical protein